MDIAQISDFHVTAPGALAYGRVDTNRLLADAVTVLNSLDPQPALVIGSGDLTQHGSKYEYSALGELLAPLKAPFLPLVGNHDRRAAFREAFGHRGLAFAPDGFLQYEFVQDDLRILALDTLCEGSDEPELCVARLTWLRERLADPRPTLLVMHHPPFSCGVDWVDAAEPRWSEPLGELVARAPGLVRILCGHVHRAMFRSWRGVLASTAPSTAHQVPFAFAAGARPALSTEAPGFQLHRWDGRDLVTYGAAIPGFAERFAPGPPLQAST
jgi:3',5'-cyclic-AMP phosphodiesterase